MHMVPSMERRSMTGLALLVGAIWIGAVQAASVAKSCSTTLSNGRPAPSLASGYVARLVATGLSLPRGIKFDKDDQLLVVEQEKGIEALKFEEAENGCIIESDRKTVIDDASLNHGIEISEDGKTLYSSNPEAAYSWDYDSGSRKNTSGPNTLVDGMTNDDHTTRTLLLSKKAPGTLIITRGSTSNLDYEAEEKGTGHSQIKAFDISKLDSPHDFTSSGTLLGWGLRNDVGVAEEPLTGRIYSVENSVDEMMRDGVDIHDTNPAEELNFLGYVDGTKSSNMGANFGYPDCYTAWDVGIIPQWKGQVGEQFAIFNSTLDKTCSQRAAPRLPFHPHTAPLDILFNDEGTAAWVTFHGSWDTDIPVGYTVSVVAYANGEPMEPSTSKDAAIDIMANHDVTKCYDDPCIRPVGLAWDSKGRLFVSSDETGEIWAILREDGESTSSTKGGPGPVPNPNTGSLLGATSMSILALLTTVVAFII